MKGAPGRKGQKGEPVSTWLSRGRVGWLGHRAKRGAPGIHWSPPASSPLRQILVPLVSRALVGREESQDSR